MAKPALTDSGERLYNQLAGTFFPTDEAEGWAGAQFISALATMKDPAAAVAQPSGTKPPFAVLFCPQECPVAWLPWVGQFVGIAPSAIEALLRAGNSALARSWIEHPLVQERGSPKAMRLAAEATLTGTKTLYFYTRFNNEAFVVKVASLTSETPSASQTREAVEALMPAWCVLEYETVSGGTVAILEASHAKLSEVEAAHATTSDLELHPEK